MNLRINCIFVKNNETLMSEFESKRPFQWLIHCSAWGVLFGLPLFFTGREAQSVTLESYLRFVIIPFSFMIVYYVNSLMLIEKFPNTRKEYFDRTGHPMALDKIEKVC